MKFKLFHGHYVGQIYRDGKFYMKVTKVVGPFFEAHVMKAREPWTKIEKPLPWTSESVRRLEIITR